MEAAGADGSLAAGAPAVDPMVQAALDEVQLLVHQLVADRRNDHCVALADADDDRREVSGQVVEARPGDVRDGSGVRWQILRLVERQALDVLP